MDSPQKPETKPKVFFDGACPVCSVEMNRYRNNSRACDLDFVDISKSDFSAEAEGLDSKRVNEIFHIKTESGEVLLGVEGFRYIWKTLPGYRWAYELSGLPPARFLLNIGYEIFRRLRPYLPKRKNDN